jgi:hypothetical protein
MQNKTRQEQYIEHLNKNVLPYIDFDRLQASYDGDKKYAKDVLSVLHDEVERHYGTAGFDYGDCQDSEGFVTLPGIARGRNTGKLAVVLVDLDLSSSGEHYGTDFFIDAGVVEQFPEDKALADRIRRDFIPYDYCYTPLVLNDHHVDFDALPKDLKEMLDTFQDSGQKQVGRQGASWTRFDKAKRKAADKNAAPPPKAPKKSNKQEI